MSLDENLKIMTSTFLHQLLLHILLSSGVGKGPGNHPIVRFFIHTYRLLVFHTYNKPYFQPVQPYTTLRFFPYDNEPHDRGHAFHISSVSFYRRHKLL
jgi:hypothetical protein